jgi:hypothetical protein
MHPSVAAGEIALTAGAGVVGVQANDDTLLAAHNAPTGQAAGLDQTAPRPPRRAALLDPRQFAQASLGEQIFIFCLRLYARKARCDDHCCKGRIVMRDMALGTAGMIGAEQVTANQAGSGGESSCG